MTGDVYFFDFFPIFPSLIPHPVLNVAASVSADEKYIHRYDRIALKWFA